MIALAYDPGKKCGWAVLRQEKPRGLVFASSIGVLDRGMADGRDLRVEEAIEHLARFCPDVVGVEAVNFVVGRAGFGPFMAGHLVRAARLGGRLYQAALDHGYRAEEISAETWRRWLTSDPHADNSTIERAVRARIANWPKVSNNHERDAAGFALFVLHCAWGIP